MARPGFQSDFVEQFGAARLAESGRLVLEQARELDIFFHGQSGQEIEKLEHESNFVAAEQGQGGVVQLMQGSIIEKNFAFRYTV
jgi:hypothetical protein